MKRKMIGVLLTIVMICNVPFLVKADQVKIKRKKSQDRVRSILLDTSHLMVNLNNNVIHVDFLILLRDVNISIINSDGRQVHQQVVSLQTTSVDIDLIDKEPGVYTIYFTDATDTCLYGEFTIQ